MSDYDPLVGIRARLSRIERKIDYIADIIIIAVTIGMMWLIGRLLAWFHLGDTVDSIVLGIAFFAVWIAAGSLRQNYNKADD